MVGDRALRDDVVLLETEVGRVTVKVRTVSPGGSRRRSGTMTSMTKCPPGRRCDATLAKQATCASCVVRFMIVLRTR